MAEDWKTRFAKRLDEFLDEREESASEIARRCGRSRAWLSNWRSGQNVPPADEFAAFCAATNAPAAFLLGLSNVPQPEETTIDGETFITLPCLEDRLAAGVPTLNTDRYSDQRFAFRSGWFERLGVPADRIRLARLAADDHGESMLETIQPGALIAIDTREITSFGKPDQKRIYVVRDPGAEGVTVKRVSLRDRQLVCTPDNPARNHLAFAVDLKGRSYSEVLVGRVVWWANGEV